MKKCNTEGSGGRWFQVTVCNLLHYNAAFAELNFFMPVFFSRTITDSTINKPAKLT